MQSEVLSREDWQWLADQLRAWPLKRVHPDRTMCEATLRPMAADVIEAALVQLAEAADEIDRLRALTNDAPVDKAVAAFERACRGANVPNPEIWARSNDLRAALSSPSGEPAVGAEPDRKNLKQQIASILAADPFCASRVAQATVDRLAALVNGDEG